MGSTRLVCISDTHNQHFDLDLPSGDVLVHSGDFTNLGRLESILAFMNWMEAQDFEHKILICGNHELEVSGQTEYMEHVAESFGIELIHNRVIEINGVSFYGEPRSQEFFDWGWMYARGYAATKVWDKLPSVDVLVTHGPPYGIADNVPRRMDTYTGKLSENAGCPELRKRLEYQTKIPLVVCGHIHEGYGIHQTTFGTTVVNAAIMDRQYRPVNKPIVIDFHKDEK